jgi:hypothetical protein
MHCGGGSLTDQHTIFAQKCNTKAGHAGNLDRIEYANKRSKIPLQSNPYQAIHVVRKEDEKEWWRGDIIQVGIL